MFQASLYPSSGVLDRMLLHMVFSTRCAGWSLGKPGSRPCALCRGCYSTSQTSRITSSTSSWSHTSFHIISNYFKYFYLTHFTSGHNFFKCKSWRTESELDNHKQEGQMQQQILLYLVICEEACYCFEISQFSKQRHNSPSSHRTAVVTTAHLDIWRTWPSFALSCTEEFKSVCSVIMNKCLCLDTRLETAACITDSLGATVIYTKHSELKH